MLDRYTWRHNSILKSITDMILPALPDGYSLFSDLPGLMKGASTIPINVIVTKQKPDLVILNENQLSIIILELTVPYELNQLESHERKMTKYSELVTDLELKGYTVKFYAFEIGSRGHITGDNIKRLKNVFHVLKLKLPMYDIRSKLCKIALVTSYVIYHSKYYLNWTDPSYVTF